MPVDPILEPKERPKAREPLFNAPPVVVVLAGLILAGYGAFSLTSERTQDDLLRAFAFMPGRFTLAFFPQRLGELLAHVNDDPAARLQAALIRHYQVLEGGSKYWTLLTYAFLHGSWAHAGLNAVWLIAFGPPVARRIGALRFVALFVIAAIAGALTHWLFASMDFTPLIGASASDSGVVAAAARFVFQPGGALAGASGVSSLNPPPQRAVKAASLFELFGNRRAIVFIGIWMATNFIFGAGAQTFGASDAPVAWVAHIGGFLAGLAVFSLLDRPNGQSAT